MIALMARGAVRGQRTRRRKYKRGSGLPWPTSVTFSPAQADKLCEILDRLDPEPSMAAVLGVIISRMPTSPDDPPLDWAILEADLRALPGTRRHEELPLVS
jgi:hypothetical protein